MVHLASRGAREAPVAVGGGLPAPKGEEAEGEEAEGVEAELQTSGPTSCKPEDLPPLHFPSSPK